MKRLNKREQAKFDLIYNDLLEPTELDRERIHQLSIDLVMLEDMKAAIDKEGLLLPHTNSHGQKTVKQNPLNETYQRLKSSVNMALNQIKQTELKVEAAIIKRAYHDEMRGDTDE